MRNYWTSLFLTLALCLLLGGCGGFPEPLGFLAWPGGAPQAEEDTGLLLGPGLDEEGMPGAEWGVFEMMRRPSMEAAAEEGASSLSLEERFQELEKQFPQGKYWNHMGKELPDGVESPFSVTGTPCAHSAYDQLYCNRYNGSMLEVFSEYGYLCQCLGFACLISDQLFGEDAPVVLLEEGEPLLPGDHVRLREYEHSVIVREVSATGLRLCEVNPDYEDCRISWSRTFTWEEWEDLYGWDVEYVIRRTPAAEAPSGSGS